MVESDSSSKQNNTFTRPRRIGVGGILTQRTRPGVLDLLCFRRTYFMIPTAVAISAGIFSCDLAPVLRGIDPETELALSNASLTTFAALEVREHSIDNDVPYKKTPLLGPGGVYRKSFVDLLGTPCPGSLDLRITLFRRNATAAAECDGSNGDSSESDAVVTGELLNVPACDLEPLTAFTVVNWEAGESEGRVKVAQGTSVEEFLRETNPEFIEPDGAWEIRGLMAGPRSAGEFDSAEEMPIAGRVVLETGEPVKGVAVVLRTRFRRHSGDDCFECDRKGGTTCDVPDDAYCGFGEPVACTITSDLGEFGFTDRPAGAYEVEFFSDLYSFRPVAVELETPNNGILIIAE